MSMEHTYNSFANFITRCVDTVVSLLKVVFQSKFGVKLPVANSDTCVILGNGPSLKESLEKHPDFFKQHSLICVNSFSRTDYYTDLKPSYYVILDPGFWHGETEVIIKSIEAIRTKTTWNLHLLLPPFAKASKFIMELPQQNPNIYIHFFNYTLFKGFPSVANFLYKKNLAIIQSQNVLVASIFLSINMGFKKTIVVGADHTWHENLHVDENNVLNIKDVHFYDNSEQIKLHPFKKGVHLNDTFKVHEIFGLWSKAFYGYIALENYAKYKNAKVYNASEVSFIDAFERLKI